MSGGGKLSAVSQLINLVQTDLRTLSTEARRKHPAVKESVERAILKLRHYSTLQNDAIIEALQRSDDVVHPLLFACETKNPRFIQLSLTSLQRLISQNAIPESHIPNIIALLWSVVVLGLEELRILQTIVLLFTATPHVHDAQLAKVLAICFRLHNSKDPVISNTATATMRQLVTALFERMAAEEEASARGDVFAAAAQSGSRKSPVNLPPCAQDAYLVFQDLCQLTNGDPPYWLTEVPEISRTLGLELLESLLSAHPDAFLQVPEFSFMLKERVCPLVIKLFSPSIKYNFAMSPANLTGGVADKPSFPVCLRLLRIVCVLIKHFYVLLVTECEIFLSLLVKFLEIDKPIWQRVLAVEVLHQLAVQPRLLRSFCYFYDLQEQSTKVFADIICSLHIFIQNQLQPKPSALAPGGNLVQESLSSPEASVLSSSSSTNIYREGFLFGGTSHAVLALPPTGTARGMLLQMLEKHEAPQVAEGYALSEGVSCLLDTVHSVGLSPVVDPPAPEQEEEEEQEEAVTSDTIAAPGSSSQLGVKRSSSSSSKLSSGTTKDTTGGEVSSNVGVKVIGTEADSDRVVSEMVKVSNKDILGSLSLLLDASQVPAITEAVLRAFHTLVGVCGRVQLDGIMLSFLQCLCRAAQPIDLSPVNSPPAQVDDRPQFVKVTPKKLLCTKCLLSLALVHGAVLRQSWSIVLDSYQIVFSALGVHVLQSQTQEELINQGDTSHLALLLQQLCQNSRYLSDKALIDLLSALCGQFRTAETQADAGREPVVFSCHLLVLCCKVNLNRLNLFWKLVVSHLLSACSSSHAGLREISAKSLTVLIPLALQEHGGAEERPVFHNVLISLSQMSDVRKSDVSNHQLTCVFKILQSLGDQLSDDWPLILQIIRSASYLDQPAVVQLGFEALQLVVADFLALLPLTCLTQCLDVASNFGLQTQDLNISLTAVGLLWNMSDFLCHHQSTIEMGLPQDFLCPWMSAAFEAPTIPKSRGSSLLLHNVKADAVVSVGETTSACTIITDEARTSQPAAAAVPGTLSGEIPCVQDLAGKLPRYDCLWCSLFYVLSQLCVDERAAVRKSAAQTLFSTIDAHGHLLAAISWNIVLWKVLFPLLECVQHTLDTVEQSAEKAKSDPVVVMHHSRNTLRKQWAETQVLTLQGIAGVFAQQLDVLSVLTGFHRAWDLLLSAIHACVSEGQGELAMAALRSLHQLLLTKDNSQPEQQDLWQQLWQVWRQLALQCAQLPTSSNTTYHSLAANANGEQPVDRSSLQALLCLHMQQLPLLRGHLSLGFKVAHLQQLRNVVDAVLSVPSDQVTLMTSNSGLTPLQDAVLTGVRSASEELEKSSMSSNNTSNNTGAGAASLGDGDSIEGLLFAMFELLLHMTAVATTLPAGLLPASKEQRNSCVVLGESAWRMVSKLFLATQSSCSPTVVLSLLKALHIPLACKFSCQSASTWLLALDVLLEVAPLGLAALRRAEAVPADMEIYSTLLQICEDFLFPASDPPAVLSANDRILYEEKDVQIVHLLRDEILKYVDQCPPRVMSSAIELLNRGSVLSQTSPLDVSVEEFNLLGREYMARACFETLLNCSVLIQGKGQSASVALESLVRRCCSVLEKFQQDEKLTGDCPLPRSQLAETSFVLHAVALMLQTMKESPPSEQTSSMWQQLIHLYPSLVSCISCNSSDVRTGVQKVLGEYAGLLSIPGESYISSLSKTPT